MTLTPTPQVAETVNKISFEIINRRWVLLIPYAVLLVIFGVLAGISLNRMNKLRIKGDSTLTIIIVFVVMIFLLLIFTLAYAVSVDWTKPLL